jgi:acetaldehyde dehydrogenase (acetylating)
LFLKKIYLKKNNGMAMIKDIDLLSIQEARNLAAKAKSAQEEYKHFSQEQVNAIVKAMAEAGYAESERLAKMAYEESGFGNWRDKVIKNQFSTKNVYESIKDLKTAGIVAIEAKGKLIKIAVPMGVVAALIPSTNPTSTAMFKAIIALKGRNGIVCSPHPRTAKSTAEALHVLAAAAEKEGAPAGLIQCLTYSTQEGTEALMQDKNIAVILATGSTPMVKAAYSAGKPAYGVGSGNVPAFIEKSADYKKGVADIFYGTTFDNGTLCSSEQAIITDFSIADKVKDECKRLGGYFLNPEEKKKVASVIHNNFRINPDIVGQPAHIIAGKAGITVPDGTRVLLAECSEVGKAEPFSMEKLSPVLAFYTVKGWLEGCHRCIDLLEFGGIGHTMAIHSNDEAIIMKFALEKPAFRIIVNTVAALGAVGYSTALLPSMTLGPGTWGGSIISENVSAEHLINIKSLAFEVNQINSGNSVSSFLLKGMKTANNSSIMNEIEDRLRARAGNMPLPDSVAPSVKKSQQPKILGAGISEDEVDKIIREFR